MRISQAVTFGQNNSMEVVTVSNHYEVEKSVHEMKNDKEYGTSKLGSMKHVARIPAIEANTDFNLLMWTESRRNNCPEDAEKHLRAYLMAHPQFKIANI